MEYLDHMEMLGYLDEQVSKQEVSDLRERRAAAGKSGGLRKATRLASARANAEQTPSKTVADIDVDKDVDKEEDLTTRAPFGRSARERTTPSAFDEFWETYPRKDDKPRARLAWTKAIKTTSSDTILAGARRYAEDPNRDPAYTKYPATWLNNKSWNNQPAPNRTGVKQSTTDERVNQNLQFARRLEAEENRPQFRQIGTA